MTTIATEQPTYGEQRTEKEKLYDAVVLERVKNGIAFLEKQHGPDWVNLIDLSTLRLDDGSACVLGQVYEDHSEYSDDWTGYGYAIQTFKELQSFPERVAHGFTTQDTNSYSNSNGWNALQQAWEDVLTPMVTKT